MTSFPENVLATDLDCGHYGARWRKALPGSRPILKVKLNSFREVPLRVLHRAALANHAQLKRTGHKPLLFFDDDGS